MNYPVEGSFKIWIQEMLDRIDEFISEHEGDIGRFDYQFKSGRLIPQHGAVRVCIVSTKGDRFDYIGPFEAEEFALMFMEIESRRPKTA